LGCFFLQYYSQCRIDGSIGALGECMSDKMYKIVIVEDNPAFQKVLRMRLESKGYQVVSADDGIAGLNTIRKEVPDLIISDLMLPGMDGHKICRLAKFDARLKHIPFMMLTSRDLDKDANLAKKCGADAFVTKTAKAEAVLNVVQKLLTRNKKSIS